MQNVIGISECAEFINRGDIDSAVVTVAPFLKRIKEGSGSFALAKVGKDLGLQTGNEPRFVVGFAETLWNLGERASRLLAIYFLRRKMGYADQAIPMIYRLLIDCENTDQAQRVAICLLEPVVRERREDFEQMLSEWLEDENKHIVAAARLVIGRIGVKQA